MKICLRCGKELTRRKFKYCNEHCKYWYLAKQNETYKRISVSQQIRMARAGRKLAQGKLGVRYN
jgi:hypothetical protein